MSQEQEIWDWLVAHGWRPFLFEADSHTTGISLSSADKKHNHLEDGHQTLLSALMAARQWVEDAD